MTWTVGTLVQNDGSIAVLTDAGERVAKVWGADVARVVALAPEMLAVLEACADCLDNYSDVVDGEDGRPLPNRAMSMLRDVEAVIAKAKEAK